MQLHQFFQDWYNGAIPETKAGFTRLENALSEGFRIITPVAQIIEREAILQSIESAHNTRLAMRIWIEDVRIQRWFENHILASYQEWQEIDAKTSCRLSSVLFQSNQDNPNGLEWLYVHETWLDR